DEIVLGNSQLFFQLTDSQAAPSVTVVASATSTPAFLAHIEQVEAHESRPAEQHNDLQVLRQAYETLRIANEFHRMVGLERDQKNLLAKILEVAFKLLPADNGVIFLLDDKSNLVPQAVRHRHEGSAEGVVVSETVLKRVTQTRQSVLT